MARFVFEPNECGKEYVCVVKVTAPDGNVLQPDLHVKMRVLVNELHPEKPNTLTGMFRYDGLLTAMPGVYRFSFFFGDFSPGHAEIRSRREGETMNPLIAPIATGFGIGVGAIAEIEQIRLR